MKNILLIIGTDTGVGKTWIGCTLARALTLKKYKVIAIKPLETGCSDDLKQDEDGIALALSTGQEQPKKALQRFMAPLAPPEAADKEGRFIDFNMLINKTLEYSQNADFTIVEGAGGLLSPLTWDHNAIDLAKSLNAKILLVSSDKLGTINQTLMTLNILEQNGLEPAGVVLSPPKIPDDSTGTNATAIARLSKLQRITKVPYTNNKDFALSSISEIISWIKE